MGECFIEGRSSSEPIAHLRRDEPCLVDVAGEGIAGLERAHHELEVEALLRAVAEDQVELPAQIAVQAFGPAIEIGMEERIRRDVLGVAVPDEVDRAAPTDAPADTEREDR